MASILYAWEFGANLGHIGTLLPIAKEGRTRGATVHRVVTHPHQAYPTPGMRPWSPVSAEHLLATDRLALQNINAVLEGYGQPKLDILAQLFQVAEDSLSSFPELDDSPARGPARYRGMLPAAVAADSTWPAAPGPRVFSYLRPETPHLEAALQALHGLQGSILIYAPGVPADLMQRYTAPQVAFSPVPVDLNKVARQADAGLTYASPAATVAFLMAGKPVLMIPGHLEQFLFAKRVEEMGAGLIQNPEQPPHNLAAMLRQVLADPGFRANAGAFATKYPNFDQNAVMTHIVARIEELADAARAKPGARP